jgi:hypothetical protein
MKKKTHEEFLEQIKSRPFTALGNYKGWNTRLQIKCAVCLNEWESAPHNLLAGSGCPACAASKKRGTNTILHDGGHWIELDTSTKKYKDTCKIDKEDFYKIKGRIQATRLRYPAVRHDGKYVFVHALVLPGVDEVDHISRDRTDCRKENLRPCTRALNARNLPIDRRNTSGTTGVYFSATEKVWYAQIGAGSSGRRKHLGRFKNKQDAINARKAAEQQYFGEFAPIRSTK